MTRLKAVVLWIDQGLSALVLASPDETFSAASHRLSRSKGGRWVYIERAIDALFFFDVEQRTDLFGSRTVRHCELSFEVENRRGHLPKDYRGTLDA